jgi:hypothetical protein
MSTTTKLQPTIDRFLGTIIDHSHTEVLNLINNPMAVANLPLSGHWTLSGAMDIGSAVYVSHLSGVAGIGRTSVIGNKFAVYGTDNTNPTDPTYLQRNAIEVDSPEDCDKWVQISDNGVTQWALGGFRGERGRFFYMHNHPAASEPFMMTANGRVGVNQPNNFVNYHSQYQNAVSGLQDDMDAGGTYDANIPFDTKYEVFISLTGSPDSYHWRKSYDAGITWTSWSSDLPCTDSSSPYEIDGNGVTVCFESLTGHNLFDGWDFTAFSQNPQGTFSIKGKMFKEFGTTTDHTSAAPVYDDRTYDASTTYGLPITIIPKGDGGSEKGACYMGLPVKWNMLFTPLITAPSGLSLVVEYFNNSNPGDWGDPANWTQMTGVNSLVDDTQGFTRTGYISWDSSSLTSPAWTIATYPGESAENYNLYWVRLRSSTAMATAPVVAAVFPHGQYRFAVYMGQLGEIPSLYMKAEGRTFVHVPDGRGSTFNVENATYAGNTIRASVEQAAGTNLTLTYGTDDSNHMTVIKNTGIDFQNTGSDVTFTNKFNTNYNFYKDTAGGNDLAFQITSGGVLQVGQTGYENLVVSDNHIPNKRYVDDIAAGGLQFQDSWDAGSNTPDISGTTTPGYFWTVSVSGTTDLGGISVWNVRDWAVKTLSGWTKIVPAGSTTWGSIIGTLASQTDLQAELDDKFSYAEGLVWTGNDYISNVGTISGGTWHGTRITPLYLDATVTTKGNTFNGANQLIEANNLGKIPALDGSLITNLNAANIATGTISSARLPVTVYSETFTNSGLVSGALAVTHNLSQKIVTVTVADGGDRMVIPDNVTYTDTNNLSVDLSSFGAITGTWNVNVIKSGAGGNVGLSAYVERAEMDYLTGGWQSTYTTVLASSGTWGGGSTTWSVITNSATGVVGQGYFVNAISGEVDLYLPQSPSIGNTLSVRALDITSGAWLYGNGSNIESNTGNLQIDTAGFYGDFTWVNSSAGWLRTK